MQPTVTDTADASAPASAGETEIARAFGRYLVVERLGEGGMGVVYRAYDPDLRREVALKLLRVTGPASAQARLVREAQALARMTHPNVVTIYDVGVDGDDVFLAMELVRGQTLARWLAQAPRSPAAILAVFRGAGDGLAAAHAAGIIHRDVKPSNLMVGDDGRVRVLDFGLARPLAATEPAPGTSDATSSELITRHGAILGTPRYMAPEQRAGRPADERTDQYGLCLALCEALAGQLPETDGDVAVPALPGVPRRVRAALERGLSVDPARRFSSMEALLAAIAPRGRRSLGLAAAALALAGTAAAMFALRPHHAAAPDPCAGAGAPFDALWNPVEVARIHAGFVAHGGALAEATWHRVAPRVDAWGREWKTSRREVCEAGGVRHEASPAITAARMACLDNRRRELASLLDAFADADPQVVFASPRALAQLEPIARCADTAALAAIAPPSAAQAGAVDALTRELDSIRTALHTGHPQLTVERATVALAHATVLGYPPSLARAEFVLGLALGKHGSYADAATHFEAAALAADRASDDALRVEAWNQLLTTNGWDLRKPEPAARARDAAAAALARVKDPGRLAIDFHHYSADAYVAAGKLDDALREVDTALALAGPATDKSVRSDLFNDKGLILFDMTRHKEADEAYKQALALDEEVYGPDNPNLAAILSNMGNAEMYFTGKYDDIIALHERAVALETAAYGPEHPNVANYLDNIVNVDLRIERFADAVPLVQRVIAIRQKQLPPDHPYTVRAIANLATALTGLHRGAEAEPLYLQALAMQGRSLPPDALDVAYLRQLHALNLLDLGRGADARAEFERSIAIYDKRQGPASPMGMLVRAWLARAEIDAGDAARGLAVADDAIARSQKAGQQYTETVARWHRARALVALGRRAEAKTEADAAVAVLAGSTALEDTQIRAKVQDWVRATFPA